MQAINLRIIRLSIALLLFCNLSLWAQQEPLFTQFMYNKLQFNPAYAGAVDGATFTALYRNQWLGLSGAPEQELISANLPFNGQKYGIGLSLSHRSIGISDQIHIDGSYAYRIPLGAGYASAGVQASARYYGSNFNDPSLNPSQGQDPELTVGNINKWVPNIGFGLYYYSDKFYAGASLPRLINNRLEKDDDGIFLSKEVIHTYLTAGYSMDISSGISLTPQVLARFAPKAPVSFDFNLMLGIAEIYSGGVTYRTAKSNDALGESIDLLFGARITPQWFVGLSYDIGLNQIRRASNGSIEAMIRYSMLAPQNADFSNPRYF